MKFGSRIADPGVGLGIGSAFFLSVFLLSGCYLSHEDYEIMIVDEPVHVFTNCPGDAPWLDERHILLRMCEDGSAFIRTRSLGLGEHLDRQWRIEPGDGERRVVGEGEGRSVLHLTRDADRVHWIADPPALDTCGVRSRLLEEVGEDWIEHWSSELPCP